MIDEELNRFIHEKVMGKHWWDPQLKLMLRSSPIPVTKNDLNPDYCNDLNAVREVEEKLGDELANAYYWVLSELVTKPLKDKYCAEKRGRKPFKCPHFEKCFYLSYLVIRASARQRCEAIHILMKTIKEKD